MSRGSSTVARPLPLETRIGRSFRHARIKRKLLRGHIEIGFLRILPGDPGASVGFVEGSRCGDEFEILSVGAVVFSSGAFAAAGTSAGFQAVTGTIVGSLRVDRKPVRGVTDELSSRFGAWYYVISAESFEKFKLTRDAVVGPKEEPKPADGAAVPGLGGPPSFDLPGLGN